ncbi:MAG: ABC transporter ATP-binding protein [Anaerolineales bacterium]|nr:ABC transporter ATP-binding protein [Anaerolineales bacterium]
MVGTVNAVEMRGIVKKFPGVLANDKVDFDVSSGEIHTLLGENGAGKSTLMNVLAGLYRQDAGTVSVHGQIVNFRSPRDAIAHGIGMVHQHFMLVPSLTVTENILLGLDEPRFRMNLPEYHKRIAELEERFGLKVSPEARIWQLSVGEQQRVELLKMLYRGADILIMDEPTAVLAPQEVEELFATLRSMTAEGKSIVFISHKLHEVMAISNRITVLRRGRMAGPPLDTKSTTRAKLAEYMVGRKVLFEVTKDVCERGNTLLRVDDIHAENDKGLPALRGVSFQICGGEILGLAGVAGNGQAELAEVITGLRPCSTGEVRVADQIISNRPPISAINAEVAHIPMDRTGVGSSPNLSIADNLIMKTYRNPPIGKGWSIDFKSARQTAKELKDAYDIIAPSIDTHSRLLSGGNLQRVILAREISGQPKVIVAVQPTRGLDVGAIEGVQRLLLEQRKAGAAILLISEELEELFSLSDRIAVIYEGEIMDIVEEFDKETIGLMMAGQKVSRRDRAAAIPKAKNQEGE